MSGQWPGQGPSGQLSASQQLSCSATHSRWQWCHSCRADLLVTPLVTEGAEALGGDQLGLRHRIRVPENTPQRAPHALPSEVQTPRSRRRKGVFTGLPPARACVPLCLALGRTKPGSRKANQREQGASKTAHGPARVCACLTVVSCSSRDPQVRPRSGAPWGRCSCGFSLRLSWVNTAGSGLGT